jgi:hypothetical protein
MRCYVFHSQPKLDLILNWYAADINSSLTLAPLVNINHAPQCIYCILLRFAVCYMQISISRRSNTFILHASYHVFKMIKRNVKNNDLSIYTLISAIKSNGEYLSNWPSLQTVLILPTATPFTHTNTQCVLWNLADFCLSLHAFLTWLLGVGK